MSSDRASPPWWRRHAPALGAGAAAAAALAWLMSPPEGRADGAEQIWAAEAPYVAPVAAAKVAAAAVLPPVAPPVEAEPVDSGWLPDAGAPQEGRRAGGGPGDLLEGGGDMALPPSLPADVVEAPPPIGDLLMDDEPLEPA